MAKQESKSFWRGLWKKILQALTYQEGKAQEDFILEKIDPAECGPKEALHEGPRVAPTTRKKKPLPVMSSEQVHDKTSCDSADPEQWWVSDKLMLNQLRVEQAFSLPKNKDPITREFEISLDPPRKAYALFIEGISDRNIINEVILKPLMLFSPDEHPEEADLAEYIKDHIIYGHGVEILEKFTDIFEQVNYGATAIFIEGLSKCLVVETKGWDRRSIEKPQVEQVIRGPNEAFNETLRSNTGLIRKALRNRHLITEMLKLGTCNKTDVALMYLENIANPALVGEIKRRITAIRTDYVGDIGVLEQFIEDYPFSTIPQLLATERPDRVVAGIIEGKVAVLMDNSPNALIAPTTIYSLLHTPEDYYLRLPYSNLVRMLRMVAIFISIVTPAIYVAITTFHQEMVPTDLMLAIAASRQTVPFPTILEVFMMEFAFELIREAGVRIPGIIGNTLGIVGALILGQAAVQAGVVSPILIIVVAITGLASFALPSYSMSFAFRGIRFFFTALAAVFGFFGVTAGFFMLLISITSVKSFGVPITAPLGPRTQSSPDVILRGPMWSMEQREDYVQSQENERQPNISRGWLKPSSDRGKEGKEPE